MKVGDAYGLGLPGYSGLVRIHTPFATKADIDKMLELSLSIGHVHRTPAEASKEEVDELLKQLRDSQRRAEEAEGKSIADALGDAPADDQASKKGYIQ